MNIKNKWTLETKEHFILDGQLIIKTHIIAIPPTNGNRIDIIDQGGKYYYNTPKSKFIERMTKDEYLDSSLPGLVGKDRIEALKNIDWTPRKIDANIAIIIEIINGEIKINK